MAKGKVSYTAPKTGKNISPGGKPSMAASRQAFGGKVSRTKKSKAPYHPK